MQTFIIRFEPQPTSKADRSQTEGWTKYGQMQGKEIQISGNWCFYLCINHWQNIPKCHIKFMWNIRRTTDFIVWIKTWDDDAKETILKNLTILQSLGPSLGRPQVDTIKGSKIKNLKELRIQNKNRVFRIFFAFDPERDIILLIGGDKKGDNRFYETMLRKSERLYELHLSQLRRTKNEKSNKKKESWFFRWACGNASERKSRESKKTSKERNLSNSTFWITKENGNPPRRY